MNVELRPITIETGSPDEVGRLVLVDDRLVALLVQLEEAHMDLRGAWSLEWVGGSSLTLPSPFEDIEAAQEWLTDHLVMHLPKQC